MTSLRESPFLLERVEPPTKFSISESSVEFQFIEGFTAKEEVTFFVGWQFLHKLKSEIFNDKTSLESKIFFSAISIEKFNKKFSYL